MILIDNGYVSLVMRMKLMTEDELMDRVQDLKTTIAICESSLRDKPNHVCCNDFVRIIAYCEEQLQDLDYDSE